MAIANTKQLENDLSLLFKTRRALEEEIGDLTTACNDDIEQRVIKYRKKLNELTTKGRLAERNVAAVEQRIRTSYEHKDSATKKCQIIRQEYTKLKEQNEAAKDIGDTLASADDSMIEVAVDVDQTRSFFSFEREVRNSLLQERGKLAFTAEEMEMKREKVDAYADFKAEQCLRKLADIIQELGFELPEEEELVQSEVDKTKHGQCEINTTITTTNLEKHIPENNNMSLEFGSLVM